MGKYKTEILALIEGARDHLTAEQVYERLKGQGSRAVLATIYNNLNQLVAEGKIRRLRIDGHPDQYDRNTRHDHLVCLRCGAIRDITLPDLSSLWPDHTQEEIYSYDLKLHYLCPSCRVQQSSLRNIPKGETS